MKATLRAAAIDASTTRAANVGRQTHPGQIGTLRGLLIQGEAPGLPRRRCHEAVAWPAGKETLQPLKYKGTIR
jgi:hypothetical protein